jgi:hypothetical protein
MPPLKECSVMEKDCSLWLNFAGSSGSRARPGTRSSIVIGNAVLKGSRIESPSLSLLQPTSFSDGELYPEREAGIGKQKPTSHCLSTNVSATERLPRSPRKSRPETSIRASNTGLTTFLRERCDPSNYCKEHTAWNLIFFIDFFTSLDMSLKQYRKGKTDAPLP